MTIGNSNSSNPILAHPDILLSSVEHKVCKIGALSNAPSSQEEDSHQLLRAEMSLGEECSFEQSAFSTEWLAQ